jgi:hypothetical protein
MKKRHLLEAIFRTEAGHTGGGLMGKFDGSAGYRLVVNDGGAAEFQVASGGTEGLSIQFALLEL